MSRTALEIFLVDQTNYFINFPEKEVKYPLCFTHVLTHANVHGLFWWSSIYHILCSFFQ